MKDEKREIASHNRRHDREGRVIIWMVIREMNPSRLQVEERTIRHVRSLETELRCIIDRAGSDDVPED